MAQIPIDPAARTGTRQDDGSHAVRPDVAYLRVLIVNVVLYGPPGAGDRGWVLIDTGVGACADSIARVAADRFGDGIRPAAIVLTHGHFDHVSALEELSRRWDCPVHAHADEHPYLNGTATYMPPDPSVGGGMLAALSPLFPRQPVDVSDRLHALPEDGSVPAMPGWRWFHTPGHAPGHVSFWREADRLLLAGDAFITTRQESAYAAITQAPELHGPPMYYTPDWGHARDSVRHLAALEPDTVVTGHGPALHGPAMREALHALADRFELVAVPEHGRYVS